MTDRRARCLFQFAVAAVMVGFFWSAPAQAQLDRSRCADCHFANPYEEPAQSHLHDWDLSPHGRNGVGCESCHGGDSSTFERFLAHRDVLRSSNPASPVHRTQLPQTCGSCHIGPHTNFQQSRHSELLSEGDRRVPTCTTCHDSGSATLLSPRSLERQCASCHGPDEIAPRPGRAADARALLEGIGDVRESLKAARQLVDRVDAESRRAQLEEAYRQAEVPLIQAREAGHRFVFDQLQERLATARERVAELLGQLVNP